MDKETEELLEFASHVTIQNKDDVTLFEWFFTQLHKNASFIKEAAKNIPLS